ncbi:hypothetical protein FA15DRAFT_584654 [Coprinopsis marcescibilis]|uniref:Cation efflux protein n=1 Tax=Coprinopsis marcescibilis TaxID=230819 RepID=A0A5C3LI68_COPMA|nr:hypothetical protein FA15DRAFT_584654 [Coprinopsis marcescibilis]
MQSPTSPTSPYLPLDSGPPTTNGSNPATTAAQHKRRHSRMHSRNLSVFFPRPGSLPHSTIDEDGGQELEIPNDYEAPVSTIPSAGSSINIPGSRAKVPLTPLGQGFKFGGRPPPSASEGSDLSAGPADDDQEFSLPRGPKRRGHHHKHSVSHNFFSFLDPTGPTTSDGAQPELHLHTQPTPMPQSPWAPMSAFPDSAKPNGAFPATPSSQVYTPTWDTSASQPEVISTRAAAFGLGQFLLGAWMWVAGQQIGSLSCTGLGYWIVFDAFGVAVSRVVPGWLASSSGSAQEMERLKIRRPYGHVFNINGRLETVLIFSQAVYLMFSSVYVCKETVEHLLLSAGGEGHHHHSGDEQAHAAINFPVFVIFLTLISLLATAILYDNNTKLVNLAGNRLPSIQSLIRSLQSKPNTHYIEPPPTHPVAIILSNPYVACPLLFCVAILSVALTVPSEHHRIADLTLASVIAVLTFNVAYRACVILGAVLLQTSPRRGLPSGKIESFLRAMREIERHPHVVHLSAPHVWQLTASTAALQHTSTSAATISPIEVHVRKDLGDDDVLALTKWVWERCVNALGGYKEFREVGEVGGPEITVGVVRG